MTTEQREDLRVQPRSKLSPLAFGTVAAAALQVVFADVARAAEGVPAPPASSAAETADSPADPAPTATSTAAVEAGSSPSAAIAAAVSATATATAASANATASTPATDTTPVTASPATAPAASSAVPAGQAPKLRPIDYSLPLKRPGIANYLWPLLGTTGINLTFWGVAKVGGAEFADVTPEHWKENFKTGFQWDDNEFEVNQVGHPYQGGLYFSTARANGLSFWQSIPYVMLGSFQWEYFLETESPSTNDWMTTTWGGTFFGEVLYRLSNRMLDDSTSGGQRFWREFAALAINPINGIERLMSGAAWRDGPAGIKPPLAVNLRVGPDGIGLSDGTGWGKTIRLNMRFDYGDPYAKAHMRVPFEVFDFSFQFNAGKSIFGQGFDGTGVLLGERIQRKLHQHLLAWVMDYQYFTNGTTELFTRESEGIYQLGEMGTGFGWYGNFSLGSQFSIDTRADALFVPTGAMTSPYAKNEVNRSYNYALGGATKTEFNLRHARAGRVYAKADRYWYSVINGAHGWELVGIAEVGAYFNIYKGHGLGGAAIHYDRHSYYQDYPDLHDSFWTGQVQYELEY